MPRLLINGQEQDVDVPDDMPLLWVLRDVVGLTGTKFGCGVALCGACTVHLDGRPIRSCITPVSNVVGKKITTIEAIGDTESGAKIQRAWLNIEVVQCGQLLCLRAILIPPTRTSTRRCRAISAVVVPIHVFARPSNRHRNPLEIRAGQC
jgi:aerobic-type carbon monoxide dehydrogenase small subunit (CoxS/CutS family)